MVLGCEFNLARLKTLNGMIASTMTELKLICLGTVGKGYDLVSQTYSEYRALAYKRFDGFDCLFAVGGISGTVGYKDSVRLKGQYFFRRTADSVGDLMLHNRSRRTHPH